MSTGKVKASNFKPIEKEPIDIITSQGMSVNDMHSIKYFEVSTILDNNCKVVSYGSGCDDSITGL